MICLALDTSSTRTGFVRGPSEGPVEVGSFALPASSEGDVGKRVRDWRDAATHLFDGIELVMFEQPIIPFGRAANLYTLRVLYSIAAQVELICLDRDIEVIEVDNGRHKKLIYGKGGAKPMNTVGHAKSWGFADASNPDEADACGVFLYGIQKPDPEAFAKWKSRKAGSKIIPFIPKKKPQPRQRKKANGDLF